MSECGTAVWENPGSSVYLWGMEYISTSMCFPGGSDGKESTCNAGDLGFEGKLGVALESLQGLRDLT